MRAVALLWILLLFLAPRVQTKSTFHPQDDENDSSKAEALILAAIEALGGERYLKVSTLTGTGHYTPFQKGISGLPSPFVYYAGFPDRERIEFGKKDRKFVQANVGDMGWVYDAQQKMIRDQTDDQIKRFQQAFRFDLENVLRSGWKEPGVKLEYVGRKEAWRNLFTEAARVEFSDGAFVLLCFDNRTNLPVMSEYKMVEDGKTTNNQARYFRWVNYGKIMFPSLQDFYRDEQQIARVSFDKVNFNAGLPQDLFAKPSDIKEVK